LVCELEEQRNGFGPQLRFRVVLEHVEKTWDDLGGAQRVGLAPLAGQRVQSNVAHEVDRVFQRVREDDHRLVVGVVIQIAQEPASLERVGMVKRSGLDHPEGGVAEEIGALAGSTGAQPAEKLAC
jgi:hypothetical protein